MHDTDVLLRATDVARVFKRDPRMPRFKQHRQHLAPHIHGLHSTEYFDFAACSALFVTNIGLFKCFTKFVVQIRHVARAK